MTAKYEQTPTPNQRRLGIDWTPMAHATDSNDGRATQEETAQALRPLGQLYEEVGLDNVPIPAYWQQIPPKIKPSKP